MTALLLDRLTVNYGATRAIGDFTLAIDEAELVALLGPSGCGKTTVLKVVAGLLAPASGDVRFDGVSVLPIPAERRRATMVFQKPLLFPHMTVAENVGFGLKMRRLKKDEIAARVAQALQLVRLEGYERRKPHELSGGQEQRVTLARALVTEPRVFRNGAFYIDPFELRNHLIELMKRDLKKWKSHDARLPVTYIP